MINKSLLSASSMMLFGCRAAIGMAGLHWLIEGYGLLFGIACCALALTALPGLLLRDPPLRDATSVVNAMLLAAHVVLGMQAALYETSALYDKGMHMLGSAAVAGLLMLAVHRYCNCHRISLPSALIAMLVLGGTLSAGTIWELFEFAVDRTGLFNAQRGLHDTMLDLLADATGAVMMVAMVAAATLFESNLLKGLVVNDRSNSCKPALSAGSASAMKREQAVC